MSPTDHLSYAAIPADVSEGGAAVDVLPEAIAGSERIGDVVAKACQVRTYDPLPTDALAVALLKQDAARVGASSLTNVKTTQSNIDLSAGCLTTITARGVAWR